LKYYAYILRSLKDGRYYYGSCENLERRLQKHNAGEVKATKHRRPFIVHYFEEFQLRQDAFRREKFFKSIDGYIWLKQNGII
jgi:putative endonuclease